MLAILESDIIFLLGFASLSTKINEIVLFRKKGEIIEGDRRMVLQSLLGYSINLGNLWLSQTTQPPLQKLTSTFASPFFPSLDFVTTFVCQNSNVLLIGVHFNLPFHNSYILWGSSPVWIKKEGFCSILFCYY